jgi:DNA invertase Pin-like site-specific DNA recombinase
MRLDRRQDATKAGNIPAAQYVRMSTEHQQYSIQNQGEAIQQYATKYGFTILKTYVDAGRSGICFKNRPALAELLQDVIGGMACYKAVLVYDVSRWGRFQDFDEAAHYEFLCKRAGAPVHYCAETFKNDNSLPACVMKTIKRVMAAEFSRELGEKVFSAEKHWAELGYKQGGPAGYGLRRLMVSQDGKQKRLLAKGEIKCLQSDRVVLVPGDPQEVACVREMFRLAVEERRTPSYIACELNRRGLKPGNHKWSHQQIYRIITHPKYAGCSVWNRSTRRLGRPHIPVPRSEWVLSPGAFEPVVEPQVFQQANTVLLQRTCAKSDEQILDSLRELFAVNGRLSETLLSRTPGAPSASACKKRFGSMKRAFELAGFLRRRD